jgi:hypothetical protein
MKDMFVLKLDSCVNFWRAKQIAGNTPSSTMGEALLNLTLDSIYIMIGGYEGSFNPGAYSSNNNVLSPSKKISVCKSCANKKRVYNFNVITP